MKQTIFYAFATVLIVCAFGYLIYDMQKGGSAPGQENQGVLEVSNATTSNQILIVDKKIKHMVTIKTNLGDIQFQTYDADAPKTVNNFVTLAQKGFYDNLIFHRVIKGFMIQGGDPSGNGTGGPGYKFEDELNPQTDSYKAGYKKGVVAMANAGPNTNGSQFFIMLEDYPLPNAYTIFGKVIKGQDIVDKIGSVKTDASDRPVSPVIMKSVIVEEVK
ncbi:MAG: peptidylprolyl isomerase [Candidatus Pacebacteria bacterium]|nr:peptidylprolyl isomerase [Candidatus Paceibacterota bacterium]